MSEWEWPMYLVGGNVFLNKLTIMFSYWEKLQYSLIYMLYKSKYYKTGKGFYSRAGLTISMGLSFIVMLSAMVMSNYTISNFGAAMIFVLLCCLLLIIFQCNLSKHKLYVHRSTYPKSKKYALPFYFITLAILITLYTIRHFALKA
jgi:hypothetical protein